MHHITLEKELKLLLNSSSKKAEVIGTLIISNAIVLNNKDNIDLIKKTLGNNLFNHYLNILKEKINNI